MTNLARTAAYIRKDANHHPRSTALEGVSSALKRELWELLRTPHTVESLSRAITNTARSTTEDVDAAIEDVLQQWIEADLVELSADS